jgi:hypothetical protein
MHNSLQPAACVSDLGDDLVVVLAGAVDGELGVLVVEGLAQVVEGANGLAPLHDYAAGAKIRDPLLDFLCRQVEVNDDAGGGQMLHGFVAVDDAAAGGDDGVLQVEAQDVVLLDFAEDGQALMVDDLLQRPALNRLHEYIRVEEVPAQRLGQQHPTVLLPTPGMPISTIFSSRRSILSAQGIGPRSERQQKRPSTVARPFVVIQPDVTALAASHPDGH